MEVDLIEEEEDLKQQWVEVDHIKEEDILEERNIKRGEQNLEDDLY